MNKLLLTLLMSSLIFTSDYGYEGSTIAPVVLGGSIIKSGYVDIDIIKKYKRKDCPVCKGTAKYLSGDGIKMVDCGYCEPEQTMGKKSPYCQCENCKCKNCNCQNSTTILKK